MPRLKFIDAFKFLLKPIGVLSASLRILDPRLPPLHDMIKNLSAHVSGRGEKNISDEVLEYKLDEK
jgi:hypothetical protein